MRASIKLKTGFIFFLLVGLFAFSNCHAQPSNFCGMGIKDWCTVPSWDFCGSHKNTQECKADSNCQGIPYRGESMIPCQYDEKGYATNCPTVGCASRCDRLNQKQCELYSKEPYLFCGWSDGKCVSKASIKK